MKSAKAGHVLPTSSFREEAQASWAMGWKVSVDVLFQVLLTSISIAFIGHIGSKELAASALVSVWANSVHTALSGLFGVWVQLCLLFTSALSILATVSFFFVDRMLGFLTDDPEVLHFAATYARWTSPTVLPTALHCVLRQYLQSQEIFAPATAISALSVVVCFAANCVLVPPMGMVGAALASGIVSVFQPVALVAYSCWWRGYHRKTWLGVELHECLYIDRVRDFLCILVGITFSLTLDEWVYNILLAIAGSLGTPYFAACSILFNLWSVFSISWGVALPMMGRCANFLGANNPAAAKHSVWVGTVLGASASALCVLAVLIFRHSMVSWFTHDVEVMALVDHVIPMFCIAACLSGLHRILGSALKAVALTTTLVSIVIGGSLVVTLPLSYVLGVVLRGELVGIWSGSVCGEGQGLAAGARAVACGLASARSTRGDSLGSCTRG
ncbi:TPA: hypothetical protein N0F65_012551 [Lagenidium giganteum]|uniref:Uncharacterized protein n=1 Tax=Lagenidium giganteum TaxID=4803 RepID=A0AAV2YSI3_9STRA|nr:TPA: hypothetical protein N0F65_012551 [Lagenidium giganteum]